MAPDSPHRKARDLLPTDSVVLLSGELAFTSMPMLKDSVPGDLGPVFTVLELWHNELKDSSKSSLFNKNSEVVWNGPGEEITKGSTG